jgi:tetratricopeptide (TPR) repeat protein
MNDRTLAHYRVIEQLGSGGMGEVYLAEDTRLHRKVALKVLPASLASDPERLERFAREAEALASLNHPNIVTVHAIEDAGGRHLLVMEYVEGHTLADEVPPGGLTDDRFFELAIPLADAVSAAHERGVTHRDLKPTNVMVSEEGRVKVVDFGLAKLRLEAQAREQTVVLDDELTEAGRILGTYPYMSPEQIKGKPADHRADIFSLGVVLYEMATGERPFSGETSADLISSILRDTPPPAHELNRDLPRHLHRILAHCLEKDADRRFQTAKDLRNELQSLQHELHSERLLRSTSASRRWLGSGFGGRRSTRRWLWIAAGLLAVALGVAGLVLLWGEAAPGQSSSLAAPGPGGSEAAQGRRPAVAVLFFQNLTGDPDLEWLRTGLTEMLVTDLSQSPGLRVLSTDRLYQVLKDLGQVDEAVIASDVLSQVAERAQVGTLLLGSYVQAGDTLQVNATLQDAESGEIVGAQRVQGAGDSGVFTVVDQLSESVLRMFARAGRISGTDRPHRDQGIESVTTSSVEAYRSYVEGLNLNYQLKLEEAIPLFQRAVELDPAFAMAYARLARIYESLGRENLFANSLDQAFAHADRLPPRERFFVEGSYYSRKRATYDRAMQTFEEAVELYPDHHAARYQLGLLESYVERFDQAAGELEELLARGYDLDGVYNSLATMYEAAGRGEAARELLERWSEENPQRWSLQLVMGWHAVNRGELDAAREALEQAEKLWPGSPFTAYTRWRMDTLAGEWDAAAETARVLAGSDDDYWHWRGATDQAVLALYHGHAAQALEHLDEASRAFGGSEPLTGTSRNLAAAALLELERPREARAQADDARRVARGDWPAWEGLLWGALARQRLGESDEADRLARELAGIARDLPGEVEERLYHRLLGRLAFDRGDGETAAAELERAEELLPPRGLPWHRHRLPDHVEVWYELGTVYRSLGRSADAIERYLRVVESGTEHVYHPIEYVRSHYFLGRLLEERGDRDGAREAYRAFSSFWAGGELDRERVADAAERLRRMGG